MDVSINICGETATEVREQACLLLGLTPLLLSQETPKKMTSTSTDSEKKPEPVNKKSTKSLGEGGQGGKVGSAGAPGVGTVMLAEVKGGGGELGYKDVEAAVKTYYGAHGPKETGAILEKYGAKKANELKPEQWAAFIAEAEAACTK